MQITPPAATATPCKRWTRWAAATPDRATWRYRSAATLLVCSSYANPPLARQPLPFIHHHVRGTTSPTAPVTTADEELTGHCHRRTIPMIDRNTPSPKASSTKSNDGASTGNTSHRRTDVCYSTGHHGALPSDTAQAASLPASPLRPDNRPTCSSKVAHTNTRVASAANNAVPPVTQPPSCSERDSHRERGAAAVGRRREAAVAPAAGRRGTAAPGGRPSPRRRPRRGGRGHGACALPDGRRVH